MICIPYWCLYIKTIWTAEYVAIMPEHDFRYDNLEGLVNKGQNTLLTCIPLLIHVSHITIDSKRKNNQWNEYKSYHKTLIGYIYKTHTHTGYIRST